MTQAQTVLSNDEISTILQQRIDQEKQSLSIVVGVIDESGDSPTERLRQRIIAYGHRDQIKLVF